MNPIDGARRRTCVVGLIVLCVLLLVAADAKKIEPLQFRPNLYFGMRERKDPGVLLGMGWFKGSTSSEFRYDCREQDGLARWGFTKADANYGKQTFRDEWLDLSTEHVLLDDAGTMLLRVNGSSISPQTAQRTVSLLFTIHSPSGVALEAAQDAMGLRGDSVEAVMKSDGMHMKIHYGEMEVPHDDDVCTEHTRRIRPGKPSPELTRTHFTGWRDTDMSVAFKVKDKLVSILGDSWKRTEEVARKLFQIYDPSPEAMVPIRKRIVPILNNKILEMSKLKSGRKSSSDNEEHNAKTTSEVPTTLVFQRVLKVPFSVTVTLSRVTASDPFEENDLLARELTKNEGAFEAKFASAFPSLTANEPRERQEMAKAALGNTLGSIGWFFGSNLLEEQTWSMPPGALLTGVPSRSFFPRGFFWDEGFHQLLVGKLNPSLAKDVIASWLTRFDQRGWVAREQVLGLEAIERVPRQFLAQNRTFANPPTLLLAVESLLLHSSNAGETDKAFFSKVFETFMRHRDWLSESQQSRFADGLMAWKGRSEDAIHTLTSGIDDYPRGLGNDFYKEAHVDLLSWACWEDQMLASIGEKLGKDQSMVNALKESAQRRWSLIEKYHWNPSAHFFNDLGFISHGHQEPRLLPHVGYVGLMPFALKLIPATNIEMLWDVLKALQSPQLLRAKGVGIRSLSKSDPLFGEGENYWRGAVWINMNFLCIEALKHYSKVTKDVDASFAKLALALAKEVRNDVIQNIFRRYEMDGYLFESYDSLTGAGRGTRPFTGWTALVVLLMDDKELI